MVEEDPEADTRSFGIGLIAKAQALLDEGRQVPAISKELGVLPNTIHKAISLAPA